jgi:uncharacterized protein (DUF1800 family)
MSQADVAPPPQPFDALEAWDVRKVGHLLRRAGFGASHERTDALLSMQSDAAVDSLLEFDAKEDPFNHLLKEIEGFATLNNPATVQQWWIHRMLNSPRPLQEKLALFWHDHFATSFGKVGQPQLMHRQIELFRQTGLGSFRDLLIAVGRDPAMLIWLDGNNSRKGRPNENYSRELMELFTLGAGSFSEGDVRQLSRAFTGWQVRAGEPVLEPAQFDDGEKEIFGSKGSFNSESAVDLILQQPPAARFLARKLLEEFVHPDPPQEYVEHYASRALSHQWQIKPLLREILTSRMFFSEWAYRSRIKSPAELCIGAAVAVGGKIETRFVRESMARMGQNLLFPPNVGGWKGGEQWINANTVLVRFNYGLALAQHRGNDFARRPDLQAMLTSAGVKSADEVIDYYARVLLDGRLPEAARPRLLDYMNRNEKGEPRPFEMTGGSINAKARGVVHLMMAVPEFQLA